MITKIDEIAPEVFRLSTFVEEAGIQFNQFLVRDEEPLLYHTGLRQMFGLTHEAVAKLIDPGKLRWISFSHFEADECGALNEWLAVAPQAQAVTGLVGAMVSVNDFANRPARVLMDGEVFGTGQKRYRLVQTTHVPHGWDATLLFEETTQTLFCSDLFHQGGNPVALTEDSVIEQARALLLGYQGSPFTDYIPYRPESELILQKLAALKPERLAIMHGSSFAGNGEKAIQELAQVWKEVLS